MYFQQPNLSMEVEALALQPWYSLSTQPGGLGARPATWPRHQGNEGVATQTTWSRDASYRWQIITAQNSNISFKCFRIRIWWESLVMRISSHCHKCLIKWMLSVIEVLLKAFPLKTESATEFQSTNWPCFHPTNNILGCGVQLPSPHLTGWDTGQPEIQASWAAGQTSPLDPWPAEDHGSCPPAWTSCRTASAPWPGPHGQL